MRYSEYFTKKNDWDVGIHFYEDQVKQYPQIVEIIEKANDCQEVAEMLFDQRKNIITTLPPFTDEKTLDKTQFYAMAILHADSYELFDKAILTMAQELNCPVIETTSDCASTKVGNTTFVTYVNNNCGDGVTANIIDEKGEFNNSFFAFQGAVEGRNFNIYDYDCSGGKPVYKLNGHYLTYSNNSVILFQKLK